MISFIYAISNMTQVNLSTKKKKKKTDLDHREEACAYQRGAEGEGGVDWECGVSRCQLVCSG